jgi:hypothetical protein
MAMWRGRLPHAATIEALIATYRELDADGQRPQP